MFRSIRGGLLLWYALILVGVLVAFGGTLYYQQRHSMYREVDGALEARARSMAAAIEPDDGGEIDFEYTQEFVRSFGPAGQDGLYFVIWDGRGQVYEASGDRTIPKPAEVGLRSRGGFREAVVAGPSGSTVLVGRRISEMKEKLRDLLRGIMGAGVGVVILALVGGWFLTGRAIRPIKRAFDQKTRFTADASHELRTPLSIVLAQAELALSRDRSPQEYRQGFENTLQAAKRMKAVVDGLLTLARADAGKVNLRRERLDFGAIVQESVALLRPLALERGVTVSAVTPSVWVEGDPDRLREAATNLVSNAIRYNRESGRVDVAIEAVSSEAVLSVKDTGIGIPAGERSHVFERFHRVDQARSRDSGGSGLGLAITQWIVLAHRGSISFTSEEGKGTTFTVRLPQLPAERAAVPSPATS